METLKQQTSQNREVSVDCLRDLCNSNKTKIVWILQFCFIKVMIIGISRNELSIFIIVLPIPIPILIFKKYCNTLVHHDDNFRHNSSGTPKENSLICLLACTLKSRHCIDCFQMRWSDQKTNITDVSIRWLTGRKQKKNRFTAKSSEYWCRDIMGHASLALTNLRPPPRQSSQFFRI